MTQVNNFDGGLSLRIDPSLIKINEAQQLVNVDPNPVVLKSARTFTASEIDISDSFYKFKDTWISDNNRDYVEYEDKLYFTEADNKPQKFTHIKAYNLGIDAPVKVLAVDDQGEPLLDDQGEQFNGLAFNKDDLSEHSHIPVAISSATDGDLPVSTLTKYKISFLADDKNIYSINKEFTTTDTAVKFVFEKYSGIKIRLHREYNGTYYKLASITLDEQRTITDLVLDISGNDIYQEDQTAKGVIQYTVTYYNENDGTESAPMEYSNELNINAGTVIKVLNIPLSDDAQVTHRRLYRLGGNLINMTLVAELDNNTDHYYDYTSDVNATEILTTQKHYPPENTMHSLTEAYSIFFGIVDNEVRFSEIDEPDVWPPENSIKLGKNGTGLLPIPQGLLMFTESETYLLTGTNKAQFSRLLITKRQGCLTHKSCQVVKNAPLWVSHEGICTLQSGYVQVLSKPLLGKTLFDIKQSSVYDEQYILLKNDGTLFILDMRAGFRFYELNFSTIITGIGTFEGKLYLANNGKLCEAFTGDLLAFSYTSPQYIENNHAESKMYNNVYIRANGTFTVKMYIDNELVLIQSIDGNTTFDLTPPTDKQRGYSCHFNIEGTGTIYTIDTNPLGRQNGS